jgi:hypothetical protein
MSPLRRESRGTCTTSPHINSSVTSLEPESVPVLPPTAPAQGKHPAFTRLPSDKEMSEMAHHLDVHLQDTQEAEDTGDQILEEIKVQYNFDSHI